MMPVNERQQEIDMVNDLLAKKEIERLNSHNCKTCGWDMCATRDLLEEVKYGCNQWKPKNG